MRRCLLLLPIVLALLLASCSVPGGLPRIPRPGGGAASPVPVPSSAADQPTPSSGPVDEEFPTPARAFAAHFTDPLYADLGDELAPFGSDEGFDTLGFWKERRSTLHACSTVRSLVERYDPAGALDDPETNGPDVDGFVIAAGFALVLLTGHIDSDGKRLVLDALRRTYSYYADLHPREPAVMIRDLERFPATDCTRARS